MRVQRCPCITDMRSAYCSLDIQASSPERRQTKNCGEPNELSLRVASVFDSNIEDCFKYDLRRPWVVEEYKAMIEEKLGK